MNRVHHRGTWPRQAHEKQDEGGAFTATLRGRLVIAARHGLWIQRIVLLCPNRAVALLPDLGSEDALNAFGHAGSGSRAHALREEREAIFSVRDLLRSEERESDRAIVKRDGVVVAALQRPNLRPAAIGELRRQQILQAAPNRRAVSLPVVRRRGNHGEEAQFGGGGIVV